MILERKKGCPKWMWHFQGARKKVGWDSGRFGLFRFGNYEFGWENEIGFDVHGVYQRRYCKGGYRTVKMRFQITREEVATEARRANWDKYAAALGAWSDLTQTQKDVYNERVKGLPMNGRNLFVKEYMLS
jgi:hypothetical protein